MLLKDALPLVAKELERGFRLEDRHDLADQVSRLKLISRCRCGDDFCATFYTGNRHGRDGLETEQLVLDVPGLLSVFVHDGVIREVELLWRDDVREQLNHLFGDS